jgi:hypothetical protein
MAMVTTTREDISYQINSIRDVDYGITAGIATNVAAGKCDRDGNGSAGAVLHDDVSSVVASTVGAVT